ncbi:hypothetical protein HU200_066389 [Digitaria exilis]|uniref:Uncharacterized protein n=1 Tax=Digitaria exilis TaxID=1010633 RepID=A0A835DSX4_9POAL|nr:hypothetical protein HU200_066389 [Digitaria exilis]
MGMRAVSSLRAARHLDLRRLRRAQPNASAERRPGPAFAPELRHALNMASPRVELELHLVPPTLGNTGRLSDPETHSLRKVQFIGGRKGFTLCCRDEYGVKGFEGKADAQTTSLHRECRLRIDSRTLSQEYYDLREQGMRKWPAYKQERKSFNALFAAIRRALERYKDHRIKYGSFCILTHPTVNAIYVMRPSIHYATETSFTENKASSTK